MDSIKKIPKTWWILFAIILVGIFLRTWNHHDWLRYNADQGRDAEVVSGVVDGSDSLPLLGPKAGGTNFRLGPAFYYFEIAAAKLFGSAPDAMAYPDLFTSILAIPLIFFFFRKYFEKYTSLSLTAIFALSEYAVRYSRFAWNPNSTPFWTILSLFAIYEVLSKREKRKYIWAVVAGIAIGIDVQFHTTLLVILPLTLVTIFAYFAIKERKVLKYFFVILIAALIINVPQLVNEFQTKGGNTKDFLNGMEIKNGAEKTLAENTMRAASCWIQGNISIISGYEISDTCSFTFGKRISDTAVFLFGSIFVIGGILLGIRYFLREKEADRKIFLGIIFVFTGIAFLIFWKMAFELSMRFYLPLIFLPFFLLGFWIQFISQKFGFRRATILTAAIVFFSVSNIYSIQKYFIAFADYDKPEGGSVDVVILKEAEVFSQFIVENSDGNRKIYLDGNGQFLFKGFKSIRYLVRKSDIDLVLADKNSDLPERYFYIASLSKKDKMLQEGKVEILQSVNFADFSMMLVSKLPTK